MSIPPIGVGVDDVIKYCSTVVRHSFAICVKFSTNFHLT